MRSMLNSDFTYLPSVPAISGTVPRLPDNRRSNHSQFNERASPSSSDSYSSSFATPQASSTSTSLPKDTSSTSTPSTSRSSPLEVGSHAVSTSSSAAANGSLIMIEKDRKRKGDENGEAGTSIDLEQFAEGCLFESLEAFEASFDEWHSLRFPKQGIETRKTGNNLRSPLKICSNVERDEYGDRLCSFRLKLKVLESSSKVGIIEVSFGRLSLP